MKLHSILLASVIVTCQTSIAQQYNVEARIATFFHKYEPEFADLHTDNFEYLPGDKIWYKIYVVNPASRMLSPSMVAYVELLNSEDQVLIRQKTLYEGGFSHGTLDIPKTILSGPYKLRAFTLWMKNFGESVFPVRIIHIGENIDTSRLISNPEQNIHHSRKLLSLKKDRDSLLVKLDTSMYGSVVVHQFGEVLLNKHLSPDCCKELSIPLGQKADDFQPISATLFDENSRLISSIYSSPKEIPVEIRMNKLKYFTRDKAIVSLKAHQTYKDLNVSVVVRKKAGITSSVAWRRIVPLDFILVKDDSVARKEVIVFPPQENSLKPVEFKPSSPSQSQTATKSPSLLALIQESYEAEARVVEKESVKVLSDNTYFPGNFLPLPTVESFLKEVVPQVRIQSRKRVKTLQLRNIENSQKIFFYKKNPLFLVDNRIVTSVDEFLSLNPQEIKSINITWKSETINSCGISSLADNGILSVHTFQADNVSQSDLYRGFAGREKFPVILYGKKNPTSDVIPDFRKTIYWNPSVDLNTKTDLAFCLSDETGEFEVEVIGYDTKGRRASGRLSFKVD